jgi:hypothetical protein
MNTSKKLKIATGLSFLIIVFPGSHVTLLNFLVLGITFLQPFFFIGVEPINMNDIQAILISGLTILSLILIYKKSKLLTLGCIIIQYLWLFYSFNKKNLDETLSLLTIGLYLFLSTILLIFLFKNKKQSLNSNN